MTDHGPSPAAGKLPPASSSRWKPLRGGFLNIYRYDRQEFRYEDGRLLLRGNNGSGKSRVLALQLPFLLDGEITPARVEPDQDPAKRMEWNLLMGGKYDDRTGYSWLEFGRVDELGQPHYQTIGCGMRAVQGRGIAQQCFFITPARVGTELLLENEQGQPLTKAKLEESLGQGGRVFASGRLEDDRRDYRRAVDAALFGLGERYDALLSLLIQLRQPQLSRKLNEEALSDALSLALPPLPAQVLEDVAEAFRSLETDRQELADLTAASESSATFLIEYRRYIQIAARRRADEVRKAHSAYENTMRKLREAEEEVRSAAAELERLKTESARLTEAAQRAAAEERTLRESPQMKSVNELENARRAAQAAQQNAQAARRDFDQAHVILIRVQEEQQAASAKAEQAWQAVRQIMERAEALVDICGLGGPHHSAMEGMNLPHGERERAQPARQALEKSTGWKLDGIAHVEKLHAEVEKARQQVSLAQQAKDNRESELNESIEAERLALSGLEKETETFFARYREWRATLEQLRMPDLEALEVSLLEWRDGDPSSAGENPVAQAVRDAEQQTKERLSAETAQTKEQRRQTQEICAQHQAEYRLLEEGRESPPPQPHTRDSQQREHRQGAPLWALCDFQPWLSDAQKAGVEAALEASGLLDAWVLPEGRLILPDDRDSFLMAGSSRLAPEGQRLDQVLRPDVSASTPVTERVVSTLLQHVGFGRGAGECWVNDEGAWQLGPLQGHWVKPGAQYIGQASREAERQRRMSELRRIIGELDQRLAELDAALEKLEVQSLRLRKEVQAAPADHGIRQALTRIANAREAVSARRSRLTEAETALGEKRHQLAGATNRRDESARDFRILEWVEKLAELKNALQDYRMELATLWPSVNTHFESVNQRRQADERGEDALRNRDEREDRKRVQQGLAAEATAHYETLENTVGKTADEVLAKLRSAEDHSRIANTRRDEALSSYQGKITELALAKNNLEREQSELETRETIRKGHLAGLVSFAGTGQLKVAHETLDAAQAGAWSVTRVVELAREIESLLEQVDHGDAAWKRNQQEIHHHFEALQTSLRSHGYLPEGSISDEVFVVTIPYQGRSCTVAELRDGLTADIQERRQLLDAREREVLENYLIDEVANHLHDLLHRALRWRDEANQELENRPMHTGMTLRFTWEPAPEAPPALAEARRLLLGARGTWSPAQRKAVGEFLQQRIRAVQAENDTGTWQDHLADAFDYRKWHRFGVERRQDGQWKRLTRRTHGTGSGGEKAIALTLPQLAAAAAHYRSASPHAPRLILLDEAFVGVDKDMRAKCLDLLCAFDLDVVMTSESEWACYPTVPAIAIYQLSARAGIDAVYASRWVWNGRQRVRDDSADPI